MKKKANLRVHVRKNSPEVLDRVNGGRGGKGRVVGPGRREANGRGRGAADSLGRGRIGCQAQTIFEYGRSLPAHYGRHVSLLLRSMCLSPTPPSSSTLSSLSPPPSPSCTVFNPRFTGKTTANPTGKAISRSNLPSQAGSGSKQIKDGERMIVHATAEGEVIGWRREPEKDQSRGGMKAKVCETYRLLGDVAGCYWVFVEFYY